MSMNLCNMEEESLQTHPHYAQMKSPSPEKTAYVFKGTQFLCS